MSVNFKEHSPREQAPIDVTPFHQWAFSDGAIWTIFYRHETGYLLRFPELADFKVSGDGGDVQGWPAPGVTSVTVEHLHLNQVLPLAMSRQGKLVMHGSAVDVDGQGLAFVGESGRGKSTLAASFATGGCRFLTDDGLHLEWVGDECRINPSHPSIRLWDDSQKALTSEGVAKAPSLDFTAKARLLAGPEIAFCDESRPLRGVYFLGLGTAPSLTIERILPAAALIELAKNSFLLDIDEQAMLALHFDELCRLANLPIYYYLDYPRCYEDLPRVRAEIMRHTSEQERKML